MLILQGGLKKRVSRGQDCVHACVHVCLQTPCGGREYIVGNGAGVWGRSRFLGKRAVGPSRVREGALSMGTLDGFISLSWTGSQTYR